MALATAADLMARYDSRRLSELNSDTGTPVTPTDPVSFSTPVGASLIDASELVLTALQQGNRYTRADLEELVADYPDSRAAPVIRVVCDIAFARLLMRRGLPVAEIDRQCPGYKDALAWVELLRQGKNILYIESALDSQLPESTMDRDWCDPYRPSNWNRMFGQWPAGVTWH